MNRARTHGGVLLVVLSGLGIATVATVAAIGFRPMAATSTVATKAARKTPPADVATVLRLCGVKPEALAAAGVSSVECNELFDTANVYCLQADRLTQLSLAFASLNQAKEQAVRPGAQNVDAPPMTVAQAQTAVDNLTQTGFDFLTSSLAEGKKAKLVTIRANSWWSLPVPYLTVNRSERDWIALRGALATKRTLDANSETVPDNVAQIVSVANGDPTVAQAQQDFDAGKDLVKQAWMARERP
jgi:hypothetical protein